MAASWRSTRHAQDSAFQLFSVLLAGGQSLEIGGDIEAGEPRMVRTDFSIAPGDGHVVYRTGSANPSDPPAEVLFSVVLDTEGDGDGVLDGLDCDAADASVRALPGEATNLTLASDPWVPSLTGMTWVEPDESGASTVLYDVLRAEFASAFATGTGVACIVTAGTSPMAQDPDVPDGAFFYLVRALYPCGQGTTGPDRDAANTYPCD